MECYVVTSDGVFLSSNIVLFLHNGLGMPPVKNRACTYFATVCEEI